MATMVRIKAETHQRLQNIAKSSQRSLPDVLDEAIRQYEKQRFLADCNAAYARLREDDKEWQNELEERALWENTLGDGLEADEYSLLDSNAIVAKPAEKRAAKISAKPAAKAVAESKSRAKKPTIAAAKL